MPEPRTYPVTATARPDGADLEVAATHYEQFLKDVFGVFDEHPELLDDLISMYADPAPVQNPHTTDQPSRDDVLAEAIVRALPVAARTIRLHRNPLQTLTATLGHIARRQGGWFSQRRVAA